jgi:parallel beta-helix repeat protein
MAKKQISAKSPIVKCVNYPSASTLKEGKLGYGSSSLFTNFGNAVKEYTSRKAKYARIVIGSTGAGYTSDDVDLLCTGSNDSAIFDDALAAISASGGEIKILEGTYTLNKPWAIERSNIKITGSGAGNTILRMTGTRNMTSSAAAAKSNNAVIYISGSNNIIEGLQIANSDTTIASGYSYGIYLAGSSNNNTVMGNTCSNSSSASISYGIYIGSSSNNTVTGNTCSNSSIYRSYGICLAGSSNNTVSIVCGGKSASFTGFALYCSGTSNSYNQIINCNFRNWTQYGSGALTTNGSAAATLPGSSTTIAAFDAIGTGSVAGFNMI